MILEVVKSELDELEEELADRCGKREVRRREGGKARLTAVYESRRRGGRGEAARYCKRSRRTLSDLAIRIGRAYGWKV